jgi:hypothetical protein
MSLLLEDSAMQTTATRDPESRMKKVSRSLLSEGLNAQEDEIEIPVL